MFSRKFKVGNKFHYLVYKRPVINGSYFGEIEPIYVAFTQKDLIAFYKSKRGF